MRNSLFAVLGVVLLCLPATVFAEPLDTGEADQAISDALNTPDLESLPDLPTDTVEAPRLTKDIAPLNKELLVSIGHDTAVLEPNTPYEIFLDDVSLGTYVSDANGQLFTQVVIPGTTLPGPHDLRVRTGAQTLAHRISLH